MGTPFRILALLVTSQGIGAAQRTITVQVYNPAQAAARDVRKALGEAGWILRQAAIETRWVECSNSVRDGLDVPGCAPSSEPGLFVISILREDPREDRSGDALGFALLAGARNGAAVIYPRVVARLANDPQFADSNLLASVIAHELGHLLSGSPQHGEGIMKANWGNADLEAMKQKRLKFSPSQALKLKARAPLRKNERAFSPGGNAGLPSQF